LRRCAGARGSPKGCITAGRRSSWVHVYVDGKKRLSGDTERQATSGEVPGLKRAMRDLEEVVADLILENRVLKKKRARGWGGTKNEISCIREAGNHPAR
jgi:hypothetical protein